MSKLQRDKGKRGEREVAGIIADLLGIDARRRVRQHDGDSDVVGVHGWAIEVKRYASATPAMIDAWYAQACKQRAPDEVPVLWYRLDRRGWRCRWPASVHLTMQTADMWTDPAWALDAEPCVWAAVAREGIEYGKTE